MISAEVQNLLDKARQSETLTGSVDAGMKALLAQVADLNAKIAAIPVSQPAATPPVMGLSDEDKAALLEASSSLDHSIATLQTDIPTNVPIAPVPSALPVVDVPATQAADSAAAAAAVPLPGTGAVDPAPVVDPAPAAAAAAPDAPPAAPAATPAP